MLTATMATASLCSMNIKQEPVEYSSGAAVVSSSLLQHITVKQEEPDAVNEHLQSTAASAASADPSESWWRDYMTLAEPKHDAGCNEVGLLRSFKKHPTTKSLASSFASTNNTSTSIGENTNLSSITSTNTTTTTTIPVQINTENTTKRTRNDERRPFVKKEDGCSNNTSEVFVAEGIVEKESSSSNSNTVIAHQSTTTVTNTKSSKTNKLDGSKSNNNNNNSSSRPTVRSSLRSVRIKEEPVVVVGTACAMETDVTTALKCETVTVKKEELQDPDDPVWLGDITPEGHYTCTEDTVTSLVPVKQATRDIEEVEMEDEGEEDHQLEDMELNTRSRCKIKILTQNIRKARLKSFRKEKPGLKTKSKNSGLGGSSSLSAAAAAAAAELNLFNYQCPFCPFNTGYIVQMKRHRIRHMADGALNCKRCDYTTKSKQKYKDHLIQHYQADTDSEEESDEEDEVDSGASAPEYQDGATDQSGNKDLYTYHQPLPSVLPVIPGGPPNMADVVIAPPETKLFEKILDLRCKYCPFFTTYRSIMNQHRTIHQAEGVMYCPQCDLSTRDKEEYKEHLERHYQKDSFSCDYCGYTTISQYLYMNHRVKHTEKTYCCKDCSYTTGFKKAFKYHCLKHSAEKLLRCKHCPFITKYRHNYRQHMATHTGKGLMFCDFCSFYSAWETNFSRHLERHKMEEEAIKLEEQARHEAEMSFATKTK